MRNARRAIVANVLFVLFGRFLTSMAYPTFYGENDYNLELDLLNFLLLLIVPLTSIHVCNHAMQNWGGQIPGVVPQSCKHWHTIERAGSSNARPDSRGLWRAHDKRSTRGAARAGLGSKTPAPAKKATRNRRTLPPHGAHCSALLSATRQPEEKEEQHPTPAAAECGAARSRRRPPHPLGPIPAGPLAARAIQP